MSDILKRLYQIARANGLRRIDAFLSKLERDTVYRRESNAENRDDESHYRQARSKPREPDVPPQILEDLANFNLRPPSSLAEVRRARNREMKKYHPDLHGGDPEKVETAKKIMQIYNASYERLKTHYEAKGV